MQNIKAQNVKLKSDTCIVENLFHIEKRVKIDLRQM